MKKFVVVLRETHTIAAVIELDEAYDEVTSMEAKRRAVEYRTNGELEHVGHIDAFAEAESAWELGAPCVMEHRGDHQWCDLHTSSAKLGESRCYDAGAIEATVGVS